MSEIYRFAGLELDTARFQVRRAGKALAVQPQVFDVLHYLVAHHDRIVAKFVDRYLRHLALAGIPAS